MELRAVKDDLMRLGYSYVKDLRMGGARGGWKGFRLTNDTADNQGADNESDDELE